MAHTQKSQTPNIHPVIMCGGSGTRLWPASRQAMPKQFLSLVTGQSLFQDTVASVHGHSGYAAPIIVTNANYRFLVEKQLAEIGIKDAKIILEPEARNTAPAIALAAMVVAAEDSDAQMLVLPSDHLVSNVDAFHANVQQASIAASEGGLVTFGISPDRPETGYGYIRQGGAVDPSGQVFAVESFIEKPNKEKAEWLLSLGGHHWNSGMFLFPVTALMDELAAHASDVFTAVFESLDCAQVTDSVIQPNPQAFAKAPNISIDYAVMERTQSAMVVIAGFGWSDIGCWAALADTAELDEHDNGSRGDAVMEDCEGTYVHASSRLVTAVGMKDHVIIETNDAVMVAPKDRAQDVKAIVETLKADDRDEARLHAEVHRPWGTYQGIHLGDQHQVKHIVVDPGQKLSLQYHHHRSEHWIVVAGQAEVTVDDQVRTLGANQSIYIPKMATHRLFNPGNQPLHLIEVQCGDYLGEDDIVRLDDDYGRLETKSQMVAAE